MPFKSRIQTRCCDRCVDHLPFDWDGLHMKCSAISGAVRRMASRPLLNVLDSPSETASKASQQSKEASHSVSKAHRARSTCLGEHCRSTDPFCSVEGLTTKLHELLSKRSMSVVTRCYAQRVSRGAAWPTGAYNALPAYFNDCALFFTSHSALGFAIHAQIKVSSTF